jgi:two-component system cell cycle sensor histidine kinase/response regulator CckA
VRELGPSLPALLGDSTQLRQVVMNLVINAAEAIVGAQGVIRLSTGSGTYDASSFARTLALGEPKAGLYAWLEVEDNGCGMDAATVAQMFDPFFTTKFAGRGLGMAAVAGIVRGHGGAIEVASTRGDGTRLRVFLPAHASSVVGVTFSRANELRGEGVVLVVDDEMNIRRSTEQLLRGLGFDVLVASDGVEAVEVFRAESARIDAVLLDLTMPRMNGLDALKIFREIAPSVPVVLTSGYGSVSFDGDEAKPGDGPNAVLPKPYTMARLLAVLHEVMAR